MIIRITLFTLFLIGIISCSTPYRSKIDQVKVGQTKMQILESLGNPRFSNRKNGKDIWIYNFFEENQEYRTTMIFQAGQLLEKQETRPFPDPERGVKEATSMKDLEQKARVLKQKNEEGFKDVND